MKFVVANFKSHQTGAEAGEWVDDFRNGYLPKEGIEVVLAPGFTNLGVMKEGIEGIEGLELASQDSSPFPPGAYTGAINARQLRDLGIKYAIVGHAERRKWFHETHQEIANKIRELLEQEIIPILCLDRDYLEAQIAVLEDEWISKLIMVYEPVAAIGSGQAEDAEKAMEIAEKMRKRAPEIKTIIYGGSIDAKNAMSYLNNGFDGLLVGTDCLDPMKFLEIIKILG